MSARAPQTVSESESHCRLTADAVVLAARPDGSVDLEFAPFAGCAGCAGPCLWKRLQAARLDRLPIAQRLEPGTEVQHVPVTVDPARPLVSFQGDEAS